tara:strand:+ start:4842 stop:5756 length:915 start_codon:yes stop_codon:yes gene_type:complete
MKSKKIIIGSRGSKLALIYAERAKNEILKISKKCDIEIKKITTKGDVVQDKRLSDTGGKGLFCKLIEEELINKKIDIAVHALKDLPSEQTKGLIIDCFLERNDPREILISKNNLSLQKISTGSVVGTSSFRREFQLKKIRKDLRYKVIRGNVDTRIEKLNRNLFDAIILSYAGVKFLNLTDHISQIFSTSEIIPSAGQGVIALQCRKNDYEIINLLNKVNHKKTHDCMQAERSVLKILEGDCETAVGAFAQIDRDKVFLEAELFSLDGKQRFYIKSSKDKNLATKLGEEVGKMLKKQSKNSYKK